MTAYKALHDKAKEIMAKMNYKGWYQIQTEEAGYGAILKLPWCEIDLD